MRRDDRGSASVWVLGFAGFIVLACSAAIVRTSAVLARHQLERSADLVALAAASQIGRDNAICSAADRIAEANHAVVTTCAAELDAGGRSGSVRIELTARRRLPIVGARDVTTRARAGRAPP